MNLVQNEAALTVHDDMESLMDLVQQLPIASEDQSFLAEEQEREETHGSVELAPEYEVEEEEELDETHDFSEVNAQGSLRRILWEGKTYVFKERRINRKGDLIECYRCFRYKRGCKVAFTLRNGEEINFSKETEHTVCQTANITGRKRKIAVTHIQNVESEMKENAEELALQFPGLSAKEISKRVSETFTTRFAGVPTQQLSLQQMQQLVYAARKQQFADTEGLIRSFPLNTCGAGDERPFYQFLTEFAIDSQFEKIVGWAHPDLIFEARDKRDLNIFFDATFKCVPKGFYQCLISMVYFRNYDMYVPVHYVLMSSKKEEVYDKCMTSIIGTCRGKLYAETVTCDFEIAMMSVINRDFPEANVVGCLFHWKQALRRKLLELKIPEDMISSLMSDQGLINLLTVVPVEEIESKTIPYIRQRFDEGAYKAQFTKFYKYFINTWLEKYDSKTWNVYDIISREGIEQVIINRTNNPLERFNRALNNHFPNAHPSMVQFVETIRKISLEYVKDMELKKRGRYRARRAHQEPSFFPIPHDY